MKLISIGIVSSTPVLTPGGFTSSDIINRGSPIRALTFDGLVESKVLSLDRRLCGAIYEVEMECGIRLRAANMTTLVRPDGARIHVMELIAGDRLTTFDGNVISDDAVKAVTRLNFCQGIVHFYCGENHFIVAGRPAGCGLLVSASYFRKDDPNE